MNTTVLDLIWGALMVVVIYQILKAIVKFIIYKKAPQLTGKTVAEISHNWGYGRTWSMYRDGYPINVIKGLADSADNEHVTAGMYEALEDVLNFQRWKMEHHGEE